jgi:hypothetical protein
MKKYLQVLGL